MLVSPAEAQVFKPRGKLAGKATTGNTAAARKAATGPAATASKKPARATGTTRKTAPTKKRHGKTRGDDDVKILDDDDDVKITDD